MFQSGFDGGQDDIQADIDQIDSCQRYHDIAANDRPLIENVIEYVEERSFVSGVGAGENDIVRRCHEGYLKRLPMLNHGETLQATSLLRGARYE